MGGQDRGEEVTVGLPPVVWFVARRLLALVLTLLVTSFVVFASLHIVPGDPISFLLRGRSPSPEVIAQINAQYGLDQPFLTQYLEWLGNAIHGDFGRSIQYRDSVSTLISSRLPTTFGLVLLSALIIGLVGLGAGILGALTAGNTADKAVLVTMTVLAAIPPFAAAILLISVFAVRLGYFPAFGAGEGFLNGLHHLALPALALSLTFIALVARVTRASMLDELGREHVEVAFSRGIGKATVIRRHVLRNATGPILTISGLLVAGLLVSSVVVESAFGLNGVGSLLVQSVDKLDFPIVQALVLLIVTAFVFVNFVVDLVYPLIDPRAAAGEAAR